MDDAQLKPVGAAWTPATPSDAPAPVTPAHALATPATPASGLATPATPASGLATPATPASGGKGLQLMDGGLHQMDRGLQQLMDRGRGLHQHLGWRKDAR